MYPEGSAQSQLKMDEIEELMLEVALLETKMESFLSQTAKRPRLSAPRLSAAVDSLLNATMTSGHHGEWPMPFPRV
jgi:hypothetical protein